MQLSVIALDGPTSTWAAMFTTNAFPGAPIMVGKKRVEAGTPLQAVIVNNKVSNVCSGSESGSTGVENSERLCKSLAELLCLASPNHVVPCSTGVIGWALPIDAMLKALPNAIDALQSDSAFPAAEAIMTTDRFPKIRTVTLPGGGRIVGFAKGAGMVEPHLATMLVYILTDVTLEKEALETALNNAVRGSFNSISIDGDESTSDTVLAVSSNAIQLPPEDLPSFQSALTQLCADLADDVVRNGEGTNHVIAIKITGAPDEAFARDLGRTIVNSPLVKCAVNGNDPNVGRIVGAVGKFIGNLKPGAITTQAREDFTKLFTLSIAGIKIFEHGQFMLSSEVESELSQHMKSAELGDGGKAKFPAHKRRVEIQIDLGLGDADAVVLGSDLTLEYVCVNADYRS